ncbi:MAG TPA: hypothetical protein VMM84_18315 [Pyrinomonadaceae bacterium]|nr:hypothetical protein [Pyrinomonadaceae bacterium]
MNRNYTALLLALALLPATGVAQSDVKGPAASASTDKSRTGPAINAATTPIDLARTAVAAHGGEKFKSLNSMVLRGSVNLYAPNSTQSIPGGFVMVTAGERLRLEVSAPPAISFKQVYDGQQSYSSLPGVELPPLSKFGLSVLSKFDQPGYTVTALPDKKKLRGFRISDLEGNVTEFYVDPVKGHVVSFIIPYRGYIFGTENRKMKEVDGVLVPTAFTQRLEMRQGTFFAEYNVKEVKLNQPLDDDVFAIP